MFKVPASSSPKYLAKMNPMCETVSALTSLSQLWRKNNRLIDIAIIIIIHTALILSVV